MAAELSPRKIGLAEQRLAEQRIAPAEAGAIDD
jgi:hypothetical protein